GRWPQDPSCPGNMGQDCRVAATAELPRRRQDRGREMGFPSRSHFVAGERLLPVAPLGRSRRGRGEPTTGRRRGRSPRQRQAVSALLAVGGSQAIAQRLPRSGEHVHVHAIARVAWIAAITRLAVAQGAAFGIQGDAAERSLRLARADGPNHHVQMLVLGEAMDKQRIANHRAPRSSSTPQLLSLNRKPSCRSVLPVDHRPRHRLRRLLRLLRRLPQARPPQQQAQSQPPYHLLHPPQSTPPPRSPFTVHRSPRPPFPLSPIPYSLFFRNASPPPPLFTPR